ILHEPSYVAYVPAIVFAGGTAVHVATRFEDDFALDPAAVEAVITSRTKGLFLGYPCNPTGAVLPDAVQDELARIADRHHRLVVDGFNAMGLETFEPRGAFYAFPRITSTGLDAETFSRRLLEEEHVAVVPGNAFGQSGAEHVRACYATSYERLEEALARIGKFVERCQ